MSEIWKDIKGYEGRYQVSSTGKVRALNFYREMGRIKELKLIKNSTGYYVVNLYNKGKSSIKHVHRLVAESFLPNPQNKPVVDHINTIPTCNTVENLRWVTQGENVRNEISHKRRIAAVRAKFQGKTGIEANKHKKVFQYSLNGKFIKEWGCMSDASRALNVDSGGMSRCCKGTQTQANGFIWRYNKCIVQPAPKRTRAIMQYDKNGNFITEWNKISDAARHYKTSTGRICACLSGITSSCKGFIWKYSDNNH